MIYGKIWLYVKPSTGIPLYLSAVAIAGLVVHLALFSSVPWLKAYYNGSADKPALNAQAHAMPVAPTAVAGKK